MFGLGTLSKYNYVLAAGCLLLAALSVRSFRVRLLDRRAGKTLLDGLIRRLPPGPAEKQLQAG